MAVFGDLANFPHQYNTCIEVLVGGSLMAKRTLTPRDGVRDDEKINNAVSHMPRCHSSSHCTGPLPKRPYGL